MLEPLAILSYLMARPFGDPGAARPLRVHIAHTRAHAALPKQYTCLAKQPSPPQVSWSPAPDGTQSFVIVLMDLDAPRQHSYNWAIYNLPDTATSYNAAQTAQSARNSWGSNGYQAPCPHRRAHHYRLELYALNIKLPSDRAYTAIELRKAVQPYLLGSASSDYVVRP